MKKLKIIGMRLFNVIACILQVIIFVGSIAVGVVSCVTLIPWAILYVATGYIWPTVAIMSLFVKNERVKCREKDYPYRKTWGMKYKGGLIIDSFQFDLQEIEEL